MVAEAYQPHDVVSPQEHDKLEEETGLKYEWHAGRVYALVGASPTHNTITMNIGTSLNVQLRGRPCRPWGSDQRVKVAKKQSLLYADVLVACPPHE
jgi:Uma2 family endonuclease